ncbi:glycosyltransferase family 2 protein [Ornithinimicrobium avium]|uniref:Glycosyltransferase family 2 protein n=1 Tax=Ornithinimicrobium avium TaxID=2283195 RepID=A0A345NMZ2_9MICO|nr:glycosyltransferase family 2 protein [Ornithinimicrobium avium]AXH96400.1 glycosyltransferase family 2 protein [Ornithinimicrobium avium]
MKPLVTVTAVVVTYNSADVVEGLLDSLPAGTPDLGINVVVVDNGSTDDTCAVVSRRPDCRLVRSTNVGYAAGINRGVAAAGAADAVLVLNPDARLAEDAVPQMLEALAEPRVGVVGPHLEEEDGALVLSMRHEPSLARASGLGLNEYVRGPRRYRTRQTVDWVLGAVLLIRSECFAELGGMDESYFLYSEETDFCLRARDRGWATVYEPRARAVHIGGASGRNDWTHTLQVVNRVRLYRRRHGPVRGAVFQVLNILSELTWVARGHRSSRASALALLDPRRRPDVLDAGSSWVPR